MADKNWRVHGKEGDEGEESEELYMNRRYAKVMEGQKGESK